MCGEYQLIITDEMSKATGWIAATTERCLWSRLVQSGQAEVKRARIAFLRGTEPPSMNDPSNSRPAD
jgi:hypothetical protein